MLWSWSCPYGISIQSFFSVKPEIQLSVLLKNTTFNLVICLVTVSVTLKLDCHQTLYANVNNHVVIIN